MRKKLTLTIDAEVYDMIKELPRKVSISEIVSFLLRGIYEELKKGREFTQEEFEEWIKTDPKLRDVREHMRDNWKPAFKKVGTSINGIKEKVLPKRKKK